MIKTRAMAVVLLCVSAFVRRAEQAKQNDKPLADVIQEIKDGKAVIVDVREQNEWDKGHLKAATLIPLSALKGDKADLAALPKDKTIYTHCVVGKRSLAAAQILIDKGYHATSIKEGYADLVKNGFEDSK